MLLLEELGRAAAPGPVFETAAVVAPALGDARRRRYRRPRRFTVRARTRTSRRSCSCRAVCCGPRTRRCTASTAIDGGRRLFAVDGAAVEPFDYDEALAFDRGALAAAAYLVGLSERMIDVAAEYARQREQYGRPIGVNQAVKHLLADALLKVEFAKPAVLPRRLVGRRARADARAATSRWRRPSPATPRTGRAAARCRCTARSGTRGKRTCSSG